MALRLFGEMGRTILGVGDQAVAADAQELDARAVVPLEPAEFRLHVLHEGAMGADHHQQHWPPIQVGVADAAPCDRRQ